MEHAPYSPMHLICGSVCALSPSSEQILCSKNRHQRNSTSLNSFFLKSKLLVSFLRANFLFLSYDQITYSHTPYDCVFSLHLLSFPSRVYLSLHFTCVNTYMHCACTVLQHVQYLATSRTLLTQCEHSNSLFDHKIQVPYQ